MRYTLVLLALASLILIPLQRAHSGSERADMDKPVPQLSWIPEGKPDWHAGWMKGYARGLDLIVRHLGQEADYVTIMGDLGLAFIMQGEENSSNRIDGAVDVGWWPLEPLGVIRLDFLEKTVGRRIEDIKLPPDRRTGDPLRAYHDVFGPSVVASVDGGKPCLARVGSAWYVITGYDGTSTPLIGMCPNAEAGREEIYRIEERMPPYVGLFVGDPLPLMDRSEADLEALRFAVALHHEQVLGPDNPYGGRIPLRRAEEYGKHKSWRTGLKAFAAWIETLEDAEHPGKPYWNGNVVQHLYWGRQAAVRYLDAVAKRHAKDVAAHLAAASAKYQDVIAELEGVDTGWDATSSAEGRARLVSSIEKIVDLEKQAVAALEGAIQSLE